jgi:uncharacterized Ntn-hydrolase superfamily protein
MTLSIAAHDRSTGSFGICGMTLVACYGALCPQVSLKGAAATQAYVNTDIALRIQQLMDEGYPAAAAAQLVVDHDPDREKRQVLAIGASGQAFAWTGSQTIPCRGHVCGDDFVVGGNSLVSEDVIHAVADTYAAGHGLEFTLRLIQAVEAGDRAGGEIREMGDGRTVEEVFGSVTSAAVLVASPTPRYYHNLRVDASDGNAIHDLRRAYEKAAHVGQLMDEFYAGAITIKPFYWRTVREPLSSSERPQTTY